MNSRSALATLLLLGGCTADHTLVGPQDQAAVPPDLVALADLSAPLPDGCTAGAPCEEACGDGPAFSALSTAGRGLTLWTSSWTHDSNFSVVTATRSDSGRCQQLSLGSGCALVDCLIGDWPDPTLSGLSAGTVTVSGGNHKPSSLDPFDDGTYPFTAVAPWKPGDVITFTGQGATVPAFSFTITFPAPPVVPPTLFNPDAGAIAAVDRALPMEFAWTPTDGQVGLGVAQWRSYSTDSLDRQDLSCIFDGAAGKGTIPVSALAHLHPSAYQYGDTYFIGRLERRCYSFNGYHFQVQAANGIDRFVAVK